MTRARRSPRQEPEPGWRSRPRCAAFYEDSAQVQPVSNFDVARGQASRGQFDHRPRPRRSSKPPRLELVNEADGNTIAVNEHDIDWEAKPDGVHRQARRDQHRL